MDYLHDCSLLDEEEILALGPCVFESVTKDLASLKKALVFLVKLIRDGQFVGGKVALIKEEVVIFIFIIDPLLEEIIDFL